MTEIMPSMPTPRQPQPDSVPMAIRVGARWRELETAAVTADARLRAAEAAWDAHHYQPCPTEHTARQEWQRRSQTLTQNLGLAAGAAKTARETADKLLTGAAMLAAEDIITTSGTEFPDWWPNPEGRNRP